MVLIVEDEVVSRRALAQLLKLNGYDARAVASAEEAIDAVNEGQQPQVALIDIDLPGMNGMELAVRLETLTPRTRPVFMTAWEQDKLPAGGTIPHLRKPLDFCRLLGIVQASSGYSVNEAC